MKTVQSALSCRNIQKGRDGTALKAWLQNSKYVTTVTGEWASASGSAGSSEKYIKRNSAGGHKNPNRFHSISHGDGRGCRRYREQ